jgi:hypothetical protein
MSKIEKRVLIDSTTERVISYLTGPVSSSDIWPGLLEVREVRRLIGDVTYAQWLYKNTGPFDARDIQLQYEVDQQALTNELRQYEWGIILEYQPDRVCCPCLTLGGDYTYWSQS